MGGGLETYRQTGMAMPGWVDRALSIAVIPDDDQETIRSKRLIAGVLWVSLLITVLSSMQLAVVFEALAAGLTIGSIFVTAAVSLFVMWRWPSTYPRIALLPVGSWDSGFDPSPSGSVC